MRGADQKFRICPSGVKLLNDVEGVGEHPKLEFAIKSPERTDSSSMRELNIELTWDRRINTPILQLIKQEVEQKRVQGTYRIPVAFKIDKKPYPISKHVVGTFINDKIETEDAPSPTGRKYDIKLLDTLNPRNLGENGEVFFNILRTFANEQQYGLTLRLKKKKESDCYEGSFQIYDFQGLELNCHSKRDWIQCTASNVLTSW